MKAKFNDSELNYPLNYREIYAPSHFGNSYEVASEIEITDFLNESKYWGFNAYSEWFDTAGITSPWSEKQNCEYSTLIWNKKKFSLKTAQELGLKISLAVTPNHVFAEQVNAKNKAHSENSRIMGQLICPSKRDGYNLIIDNYTFLFNDLVKSGITLDSLKFSPYDYGGCDCEKCVPWIITFAKLARDIYKIAKQYFPEVIFDLMGWWWSKQEHKMLSKWANDNYSDIKVNSLALHIKYNCYAPEKIILPNNCKKRAFLHIGYGNTRQVDGVQDIYGLWGPVSACKRLEKSMHFLKKNDYEGFSAYAEGSYHDINNVIVATLSSGKTTSAYESLQEYATYYFKCLPELSKKWAQWIIDYENCEQSKCDKKIEKDFKILYKNICSNGYNWRIEHWKHKLELFNLHRQLAQIHGWPKKKLELVDKWRKKSDLLRRKVYGLGIVRHIFQEHYCGAQWYREWESLQGRNGHTINNNEY